MENRSDRYSNSNDTSEQVFGSRTARNADLYREIRESDVTGFDVRSNAKVIDNASGNSIDLEHIKGILDTHYNDKQKLHTIPIDDTPKREKKTSHIFETTKEYDLNAILNKAKESKTDSYEEDRVKRLRDTQFDILSNLNLDPKDYIEEYDDEDVKVEDTGISLKTPEDTQRTLEQLINTIALNEKQVKKEFNLDDDESEDTDPLDILEDLKGDDNTTTLEGLKEKTEALMKLMDEDSKDVRDEIREEFLKDENTDDTKEDDEDEKAKTSSLDNSFFTSSVNFKKSDFENFEDLEESKKLGPVAIIFIILLAVAFGFGVFLLIKTFL